MLPATSAALIATVFAPETRVTEHEKDVPVMTAATGPHVTEPGPERASVTLPVIESCAAATVAPSAGEFTTTAGGVLSSLIVAVPVAVFPALSRAVPEISWLLASVVTVVDAGHTSTPLKPSEQLNATVTFALFQPAAFGAGDGAGVITGGALSMFNVKVALAAFPALSLAVPGIA
jgi:hypothetical protein